MSTVFNNGRTDQRLDISGHTGGVTIDIEITLGANKAEFGLPGGGWSFLVSTAGSNFGNRIYNSSNIVYIYNANTKFQIDSGTVYDTNNMPGVDAINTALDSASVIKIIDYDTTASVIELFNSTINNDQETQGMAMDVSQIVIKRSSDDVVLATFDMSTPSVQYTDSGYTLDYINYSAADVDPPSFSVAPSAGSATGNGHTITATVDEGGSAYGVMLDSGAAAPSASQIKAGTDASDVALDSGRVASTNTASGVSFDLVFDGGSVSTEYDYYVVAEDSSLNIQNVGAANKVTATTTAGSFTIDGGQLQYGAAFTFTYTGMASVASPIVLGPDSQGNTLNIPVTDNGDGTGYGTMPSLPSSGTANLILIEDGLTITATEV